MEIVVADDAPSLSRVAAVIKGAVVLHIHADVVEVAIFHELVIAQHQEG